MWTRTERARQLVHHAARLGDTGAPNVQAALFAAKLDVAETAVAVTNAAMMLAGDGGIRKIAHLGACCEMRRRHMSCHRQHTFSSGGLGVPS
jgi:alkylation response protein AidB-like acyl-CoA dehydrogenase